MAPWAVNKACSTEFTAYHDSGPRELKDLCWIVIHCTEQADTDKPTSARGVAEYFAGKDSGGSAQLCVGDLDCYRTLADRVIPWGAPPLNYAGVHIEISGRAEWSRARWLLHSLALRRAAYKASLRCGWYGIPPVFRDAAYLAKIGPRPSHASNGGITTHAAVSAAFHKSDHTDPGPDFPMGTFIGWVSGFLNA
jgi:hypothetical protein